MWINNVVFVILIIVGLTHIIFVRGNRELSWLKLSTKQDFIVTNVTTTRNNS